ncbi:hypothetical protein [Metabacillus litoralis]|nr:hypothetical protein [Metabacillus litoralis]
MTICYYGLSLGLAQVFGLKSYRKVVMKVGKGRNDLEMTIKRES